MRNLIGEKEIKGRGHLFAPKASVPLHARLAALVALALFAAAPVSWAVTKKTLYAFPSNGSKGCYPVGTLSRDGAGALYGATFDCGTGPEFKLVPPLPGQTPWSISVLHSFKEGPGGAALNADPVMDAKGALYGTAAEYGNYLEGVVFRLTPPAAGQTIWTETILHAF